MCNVCFLQIHVVEFFKREVNLETPNIMSSLYISRATEKTPSNINILPLIF